MDWREEWFEFEDVAYLNAAGQGPLPRVSLRAAQVSLEWKKHPHLLPDSIYFELPDRVRAGIARLIGGEPHEVALTTGATGGLAAVAGGLEWKPEDEVLLARGEFPAHFTTWLPMEAQGRLRVKVVAPRGRFLTADDFIEQLGPRTRLVSASLVRFDDAARLDAPRVAQACHAAGAYVLLDVSQCAGAMPLDVKALGADFLVCAGYKWLLSPFGTGFFWARSELIEQMRVGPFYWMALENAAQFHTLSMGEFKLARGARRWDSPETASFFNLAAMEASLEFLHRVGVETIWQHNQRLMDEMLARLPLDRCLPASPREAASRGPYACVTARSPEKSAALYQKLRDAKVIVSLREGALRVAPHLYNTERDIDKLLSVLSVTL